MTKPTFASLGQKTLDSFWLGAIQCKQARAGRCSVNSLVLLVLGLQKSLLSVYQEFIVLIAERLLSALDLRNCIDIVPTRKDPAYLALE